MLDFSKNSIHENDSTPLGARKYPSNYEANFRDNFELFLIYWRFYLFTQRFSIEFRAVNFKYQSKIFVALSDP